MSLAGAAIVLLLQAVAGLHELKRHGTEMQDPIEKCQWRTQYREDICYQMRRDMAFASHMEKLRIPRRGIRNMTQLRNNVWKRMKYEHSLRMDFFEAWEVLIDMQACDVIATKETWTWRDTEQLQLLTQGVNFINATGVGLITTEGVKSRLPSIRDLHGMALVGNYALVGTGSGLSKHPLGDEIDRHPQVIRFNSLVGADLDRDTTGLKSTIQVVDAKMEGTQDVVMFDLEGTNILRSYCNRLFEGGLFPQSRGSKLFMLRPSAYCRLPQKLEQFSRGFLFYWFLGSLSKEAALYGFVHDSPASKWNVPRFTEAEQIVYEEIVKQWQGNQPPGAKVALARFAETGDIGIKGMMSEALSLRS